MGWRELTFRGVILLTVVFSIAACTTTVLARDLANEYQLGKFKLGQTVMRAYLADTAAKREVGLMYVETLPPDTGMLFIFPAEQRLSFWMKNTQIPLAIGFFDAKSLMVDSQEMAVAESVLARLPPTYSSRKPARLALEMEKGWITRHSIKSGQRLCRLGNTDSSLTNEAVPHCP